MDTLSDKQYLEAFIHDNPELEQLEDYASEFNLFEALKIDDNETGHSNVIAWLLDPSENHGLGDYFLSSFLKKVCHFSASLEHIPSVFDIDSWHYDDADIKREWRNIDILIRCDSHKLVCGIENKVRSGEHDDQLRRYKEVIHHEFPGYHHLLVYLTPEGERPSLDDYSSLSYQEIAKLLDHILAAKRKDIDSDVFTFLTHYKQLLRRHIMKDVEIQEICKKIYKSHKRALELIFEFRPDQQLEIKDLLVEIIKADSKLILDDFNKTYIRFLPECLDFIPHEGSGWTKSKRILLFEINNSSDGLRMTLYLGPGPQEVRRKFYDFAKANPDVFNKTSKTLNDQWNSLYSKSLARGEEYADKEIEEVKALIADKFRKWKESDLPKIVEELMKLPR